jgi:hypothetical protein
VLYVKCATACVVEAKFGRDRKEGGAALEVRSPRQTQFLERPGWHETSELKDQQRSRRGCWREFHKAWIDLDGHWHIHTTGHTHEPGTERCAFGIQASTQMGCSTARRRLENRSTGIQPRAAAVTGSGTCFSLVMESTSLFMGHGAAGTSISTAPAPFCGLRDDRLEMWC